MMASVKNILKPQLLFLVFIYLLGVFLRLVPHLNLDPRLLTFEADIWYRLCLAQWTLDHGTLPVGDIRYEAYGFVPFWYNPLAVYGFVFLSKFFALDLMTVTSRIIPFIEALSVLPIFYLCRSLYNVRVAVITTLFLSLTPNFIYWTAIATPQSFTLFMIPVCLLLWIRFIEGKLLFSRSWVHLLTLGILFAVNFLMHLSFFNLLIILTFVHLALVKEKRTDIKSLLYLFIPLAISQALTAWWWMPHNLYFWWTQAISTSTAFFEGKQFLNHYGTLGALLGHASLLILMLIIFKKRKALPPFYLIPIFWAMYPFIESHMEVMLRYTGREELVWNAFVRPIEGFRFYSFLAQPLAISFALVLECFFNSKYYSQIKINKTFAERSLIIAVAALLTWNLFSDFNLTKRLQRTRVTLADIEAAQWFRNNSKEKDRILADYYTAQMFSGISGGKALLGSMFPLKKVNIPYISGSWQVLEDIYSVFKSDDIKTVEGVLNRYGVSHVYLSNNALRLMEFSINGYGDIKGLESGKHDVLVQKGFTNTLRNPKYFRTIYECGDVQILEWINP